MSTKNRRKNKGYKIFKEVFVLIVLTAYHHSIFLNYLFLNNYTICPLMQTSSL